MCKRKPDESFEDYKARRKREKDISEGKVSDEQKRKFEYLHPNGKLDDFRFMNACKQIPPEHDTILRAISEYGEQNLHEMKLLYILVDNAHKNDYIAYLKDGIEKIQNGTLTSTEAI
jgi:hypothetical protein